MAELLVTPAAGAPGASASLPLLVPAPAPEDAAYEGQVRQARRLIVAGIGAIALAIFTMLAWAWWAPLSGSIVAAGMVKVDSNRKTVQHRDGGIVSRILVREGDHVAAGQALVELADTRIDATFDMTASQLDAQRIKQSRLEAERDMVAHWKSPAAYQARLREPRIADLVAREAALFSARRSALDAQMRTVERQVEEAAAEASAREREHESVVVALAHMQEELAVNESLLEQHYVDKTRVLALRRNVAEYRIKLESNQAELAKAKQNRSEYQFRLAGLRETFAQDAATQLRDTNAKIVDLEEQLRAARDASERKLITAPVAGRVVDLRVTTAGGSIGPRDPVLDIVPDGSPLLVEARVGVDAIGELRVGQSTDVRLTAYKQRTTPLITGKVVYVSADSLADKQNGAPYFLMHVELDRDALRRAGEVALQPGMGAEVFVRTHDRTPMDYLFEPFMNAARRSFREY